MSLPALLCSFLSHHVSHQIINQAGKQRHRQRQTNRHTGRETDTRKQTNKQEATANSNALPLHASRREWLATRVASGQRLQLFGSSYSIYTVPFRYRYYFGSLCLPKLISTVAALAPLETIQMPLTLLLLSLPPSPSCPSFRSDCRASPLAPLTVPAGTTLGSCLLLLLAPCCLQQCPILGRHVN